MGKTKKLYLTRRILAMILAAAMSVTMIPSTALAAPADGDAMETIVNDVAEENGDVNTPEDKGEQKDTGDVVSGDKAADDVDGAAADKDKGADDAIADGGKTEVNADGDTPAAMPVYEIVLDSSYETKVVYNGNGQFTDILYNVTLKKDGEEVSGDGVTCTWKQKGTDGNYADITGNPINAGSYRAVLTYPKQDGVHNGAEKTVDCVIEKAPVTVKLESRTVKPGTLREKVEVPVIDKLICNNWGLEPEDVTLTLNKIRNAVTGEEVTAGTALKKNGDYVMDLTPDFSDKASVEKKNNYELKPFTADIKMDGLIGTRIEVKPADKYKQEGETEALKIWKDYDGEAIVPTPGTDFTFEVFCEDATAESGWKKLDGAVVTGEWAAYSGSEVDANGKVKAPTDASDSEYTYKVMYAGEAGVYEECEATIAVKINQAQLTVEAANDAPLTVMEGTTVKEALSKIKYKVLDKSGNNVIEKMKADHIWGTGFNFYYESQIYEPLFTMQCSNDGGESWNTYDSVNESSPLEADKKYRVVFKGKKAVFTEGGWCYSTGINSTTVGSATINGVNTNYTTNEDTAAGKELAVNVTPGTEALIDVSGLLGDNLGVSSIENLKAVKEYDGKRIFETRSQYKGKVYLKSKADNAKITTEFREFSYRWEKYTGGDRIDALVQVKNQESLGWDDEDADLISPKDAGVYKLIISYEDKIDDGTYYYVKEPEEVYFAIDPKQVKLVPKAPETPYEVFAGTWAGRFFYEQKPAYDVKDLAGANVTVDNGVVPRGKIVRTEEQTAPAEPVITYYDQDGDQDWSDFEKDGKYQLQGAELRKYERIYDPYGGYYYGYAADPNYTCYSSIVETKDGVASRKDTFLNTDTQTITVVSMGTDKLTITTDLTKWAAKEKVYDAKPFDEKELIAEGLVTVSDAEVKLKYRAYCAEEGNDYNLEDAMDAGTYTLYACFDGDKKYARYSEEGANTYPDTLGKKLGTFKITPREITVTADLDKSYKAGTSVSTIVSYVENRYKVTGYAPGQEKAFVADNNYENELAAWNGVPTFEVTEAGSKTALDNYDKIQRGKNYEVRYSSDNCLSWWWDDAKEMNIDLYKNYKVKDEKVAAFEAVAGNSEIESVDRGNIGSVEIQTKNDASDPMKREVTMTEAIKWSSYTLPAAYNRKKLEGNLIAFQITAPAEYDYYSMPATAMYRNEIEAKGGYIVFDQPTDSNYFVAVFNAADGDKEIKLRWEDGYVETYTLKFSEAVKLENLEAAVAPKALAFNAAPNKLAVGQEEQLDVKITKEQMGDVIYLGYESSDPKTLVVTKSGKVTALKIGSATVTVFPQHMVNGKAEPILDANGKYVKSATLKVQVTKLDAPKKVKATAHGEFIDLDYDSPAYGYRREIYVAKKSDKFKTAQNFETELEGMKEYQWKDKGFAIAPIYLDKNDEKDNREDYKYTAQIWGLDVKTDYTIYVRNVCAVRTLTDGTGGVVTQKAMNESAAGAVVNVKTKKAEVASLSLSFYDPKAWTYDTDGKHKIKFSELKNGTVECRTMGAFPDLLESGELLSDYVDRVLVNLPFGKEDKVKYKDVYEEPKLEYALDDCYDKKTDTYGWGTKNDYASIDKKGKIKITGIQWYDDKEDFGLKVRVRDTVTGKYAIAFLPLMLEDADSVSAAKKSVTLSVGQEQDLGDLLTYSIGKTKLTAYPNRSIDLEKVRSAIKSQNQEKNFTVDEYGYLTAINGGGKLTLDLTDKNVAKKNPDKATATVTINSKDLEPIKKLSANDVSYDRFRLNFTYTGYAYKFLLEISDAKKPVYSKVITWGDYDYEYSRDKDGNYLYDKNGYPIRVKDSYEISKQFIKDNVKLFKESQYTVTLTPIYGAIKAKPAAAKVKTTKIPVVDDYIDAPDYKGGIDITVSESNRVRPLSEYNPTLSVVSGNTYTLTAEVQHNRGRVNDTLVWTVGDAKVANVKAAAGTYCITLKGLKPGTTTLEVRSKILGNKVIARYVIKVEAVKDAYHSGPRYYGDNEPE